MKPSNDLQRHLPLSHLSLHVMLSVAEESRHGYAIIGAVEEISGGVLSPGTGTFYSAIHRLTSEGLLSEVPAPPGAGRRDARRRYYGLTELGRQVLEAELTRLETLLPRARALGTETVS